MPVPAALTPLTRPAATTVRLTAQIPSVRPEIITATAGGQTHSAQHGEATEVTTEQTHSVRQGIITATVGELTVSAQPAEVTAQLVAKILSALRGVIKPKWGWESIEMVQRYAHLALNHLTRHARYIDSIFWVNVPNLSQSGKIKAGGVK